VLSYLLIFCSSLSKRKKVGPSECDTQANSRASLYTLCYPCIHYICIECELTSWSSCSLTNNKTCVKYTSTHILHTIAASQQPVKLPLAIVALMVDLLLNSRYVLFRPVRSSTSRVLVLPRNDLYIKDE
jgi:hypothetical protein